MAAPRKTIRRNQRTTNQIDETPEVDEETLETPEEPDDDTPEVDQGDTDSTDNNADEDTTDESAQEPEEKPERMLGAPRDGRSFRPGEKVIFEGVQRGGLIHVTKPVYRGVKTPGTDRWRFHLLLGKGSTVSASKAKPVEDKKGSFESTEDLTH